MSQKHKNLKYQYINNFEMGNCIICVKPKNSKQIPTLTICSDQPKKKKGKQNKIQISNTQNKKSIVIKTNPQNMKLMGIPKKWLKSKYCDTNIVDVTKINQEDLSDIDNSNQVIDDETISSGINQVQDFRHIGQSIITESDQGNHAIKNSDIVISLKGSLKRNKSQIEVNQMVSKLQIDTKSKFGIKNLPEDWALRMEASGLIDQQVKQNPQAMVDLIRSSSLLDMDGSKSEISAQKLISYEQFLEVVHKVQVIYYNPVKDYEFKKKLGYGAMCQVFQAVAKNPPKNQYAVRVMKGKKPEDLPKIQEQIAIMKLCESENIVKHIETYFYNNAIYMFIEYMNAGSLTNFIERYQVDNISEDVIAYILNEILKGVQVLHKKKRIHRDLKSDNILLNNSGEIKIADFGFATQLTQEKQKRNTLVGTPCWMAPQLIRKNNYTQKVDIWSIGVIILQLLNGEPPYLRLPPLKAMYQIAAKNIPKIHKKGVSDQLQNFYERCMVKDPQNRATCKQLLEHPFLKRVTNKSKQKFVKCLQQISNF